MPQAFHFGNTPRNSLRGGALRTVDLTASKEFVLTERVHADFDLPSRPPGPRRPAWPAAQLLITPRTSDTACPR